MESTKREVLIPPDPIPGPMAGYITGLDKYTNYLTSVLCFTNPGEGPSSNAQSVDTHEDGKKQNEMVALEGRGGRGVGVF